MRHVSALMHGLVLRGQQEGWVEDVEIAHDLDVGHLDHADSVVVRMSGQRVRISWEVLEPEEE